MQVIEISKTATPERFFLPRLTDDAEPITVYDDQVDPIDPAQFTQATDALHILPKKVYDGTAYYVFKNDRVQIYWQRDAEATPRLIAEMQLIGQVYVSGAWQNYTFEFGAANITTIESGVHRAVITRTVGATTALFGLEWSWKQGNTKQTFYLDVPGRSVRIRWQTRVLEAAIAQGEQTQSPFTKKKPGRGLRYSVADYQGTVIHGSQDDPQEGWVQHWWTFEPDGAACDAADSRTMLERYQQAAGLVVDPYIEVDEQSTYIDVLCDGYDMRFYHTDDIVSHVMLRISDADEAEMGCIVRSSSTDYSLGYDPNRVVKVLENTPIRTVIQVVGQLCSSAGTPLTNSGTVTEVWYIYSDRFFVDVLWQPTGTGTFDTQNYWEPLAYFYSDDRLTSASNYYENSGSETLETTNVNRDSADYLYLTASEADHIIIFLSHSEPSGNTLTWHQTLRSTDNDPWIGASYVGGGFVAGDYRWSYVGIVDAPSRSGSAKLYNSTDRLAMGDQWKDLDLSS